MLNNYIGKKVRILVSSRSGATSISAEQRYCNGVMTSVMNFYGVIKRVDNIFIELEDAKYTLYNLDIEKNVFGRPIAIDTPIFESEVMIININNIIAVSLI